MAVRREYRTSILDVFDNCSVHESDAIERAVDVIETKVHEIRDMLDNLNTIEDLSDLPTIRDLVNDLAEGLY
jgi:hypothetical protein